MNTQVGTCSIEAKALTKFYTMLLSHKFMFVLLVDFSIYNLFVMANNFIFMQYMKQ